VAEDEKRRRRSRFVWEAGDVEFLTHEEAFQALGFDPSAEDPEHVEAGHHDGSEVPCVLGTGLRRAASRLECFADEHQLVAINEQRHLDPVMRIVVRELVEELRLPWSISKPQAKSAEWPKLGSVDIDIVSSETSTTFVELKCGAAKDALAACAWDAAKCAYLLQRRRATDAYLIAGAPRERWSDEVRGAEFFADRTHDMSELRRTFAAWWERWEKDGYPVGSPLPSSFVTRFVAEEALAVGPVAWLLRLARVEAHDGEWIHWTPLLTNGSG